MRGAESTMEANELLRKDAALRSSKCLNNLIGQDHRNIKSGVKVFGRRDGRLPKFLKRGRYDPAHRAEASYQQTAAPSHKPAPPRYDGACFINGSSFSMMA